MNKIIVVGGGGHAKVVISLLLKNRTYEVVGYTDFKDKGPLLHIPYLGTDGDLASIKEQNCCLNAVIGLGNTFIDSRRKTIRERLDSLGFRLPIVVSSNATVNLDVRLGAGTVLMDGVIINSGTSIGECAIVNTGSSVDHDCTIGDYVHIAPGATLSGDVCVGTDSMIGTGAVVVQGVVIGEGCMIGAGAVVVEDCLLPGVYVGVPARRRR